jgi:hypothetical protein
MNQSAADPRPRFTAKQGQYLAFIHAYKRLLGRSPAEAEMQRFFQVTPPSVHQMEPCCMEARGDGIHPLAS